VNRVVSVFRTSIGGANTRIKNMNPASQKPENDTARIVTLETVPYRAQAEAEGDNSLPENAQSELASPVCAVPNADPEPVARDRSGEIKQDSKYKELLILAKGGIVTIIFYVVGHLFSDLLAATSSWKKFVASLSQMDVSPLIKFLQYVWQAIEQLVLMLI
jgi:hypothetical protein